MLAELESINALRLSQDWSWHTLADQFTAAGVPLTSKTLYNLLTRQQDRVFDRTLFKIRTFLVYATKKGWMKGIDSNGHVRAHNRHSPGRPQRAARLRR